MKTTLVLLFIALSPLAAAPTSVSGGIESGLLWGTASELLYRSDALLSKLDWPENNVPFVKIGGELDSGVFFIDAAALFAIPVKSGILEDSDWQTAAPSVQSSYSEHGAHLDSRFDLSASLSRRGRFSQAFRFSGGAGLQFRSRAWSAIDGYVQHPPNDVWTADAPKKPVSGTAITYAQTMYIPFILLTTDFTTDRFDILLRGTFYPYMYVKTVDTHYTTGWEYTDKMSGGIGAGATLTLRYKHRRFPAISLSGSFETVSTATGQTFSRPTDQASKVLTRSAALSPKMESVDWSISAGVVFTR
jgi:outer membrane protease